eukprot:11195506-Lingulodinium_polyedra.AAC.1
MTIQRPPNDHSTTNQWPFCCVDLLCCSYLRHALVGRPRLIRVPPALMYICISFGAKPDAAAACPSTAAGGGGAAPRQPHGNPVVTGLPSR